MRTKKSFWSTITVAIIALVMISMLFASPLVAHAASVVDDDFVDFNPIQIGIPNKQFDDISGSLPATATGWGNTNSSDSIAGVIDLTPSSFSENRKNYKLDSNDDGKDGLLTNGEIPKTPFGTINSPSTNKNVLLLNTDKHTTVTKMSSDSVELDAYSYYKISVWVKTGVFGGDTGASIAINGLQDSLAFVSIDTTSAFPDSPDNYYNWQQYSFYIQTGFTAPTISLDLSVGYSASNNKQSINKPANGYAMFDNIIAEQVSPRLYSSIVPSDTATVVDYPSVLDSIEINGGASRSFEYASDASRNLDINDPNDDIRLAAVDTDIKTWSGNRLNIKTIDVDAFSPDKDNITTNPMSPTGTGEITLMTTFNPNSTNDSNKYTSNSLSLTTNDMVIKRQQYYRFSVWVKTIDVSDGIGAYVRFTGENTQYNSDPELSYKLNVLDSNIESDNNITNYGWVERSYYIQGSSKKDNTVQAVVGLGHKDEGLSKGNVFFANPQMMILTQEEFNSNSAQGTLVTFDAETDTGIVNGDFNTSGTFDEYKYPLPASNWNSTDASNSNTGGWSNSSVNTKSAKSGIVPVDKAHFAQNIANNNYPTNIIAPTDIDSGLATRASNVFVLYSGDNTAIGMESDAFVVDENSSKAVTVKMYANTMGYGANLVLKNSSNIIATIEGIKDTDGFETFTFYIEASSAGSLTSLSVEVWLGMGDDNNNMTKQSKGYVYVERVSLVDIASALPSNQADFEFGDKLDEYKTMLSNNTIPSHYAMYSNATDEFLAFDKYTQNFVKTPYDWQLGSIGGNAVVDSSTVTYGVYNGTSISKDGVSNGFAPIGFNHDSDSPFGMYLSLNTPTAASFSPTKQYTTETDSFYKLTVSLNADLSALTDDSKGLSIGLAGSDYKFEDIRDTRKDIYDGDDKYKWQDGGYKDYTFYVATSNGEAPTLSIELSLGGVDNRKEWAMGKIYIGGIHIETISNETFDSEISDIDDDYNDYALRSKLIARFDGTSSSNDDNSTTGSANPQLGWIVIPSVLFAVAIIVALVGTVLRKISERTTVLSKPNAVLPGTMPSYDRRNALANSMEDATLDTDNIAQIYNAFDDNVSAHATQPLPSGYASFADDVAPTPKLQANDDEQIAVVTSIDTEPRYAAKSKRQQVSNKPLSKADRFVDKFED